MAEHYATVPQGEDLRRRTSQTEEAALIRGRENMSVRILFVLRETVLRFYVKM